jgi:deazaflavin-dependent oxidoreductase (nitroreductase family)
VTPATPPAADSPVPAVAVHARRYAATGGAQGHDWNGACVLLLTVTGRRTGALHRTPLIYGRHDCDYILIASGKGAALHPAWYLNLTAAPAVTVQVRGTVFPAQARTVTGPAREELWDLMAGLWPAYRDYQAAITRLIPVVALTPQGPA